jgi:hypothetical protein
MRYFLNGLLPTNFEIKFDQKYLETRKKTDVVEAKRDSLAVGIK